MDGLNPYPEYRASRLSWLARIPQHWAENRAKCYYREVDERSTTGGEELLSVSHITGVTPRSQKNVTMFKAESYVGHKLCRPGDLVINTMWAWMAALGVAKDAGLVSPSYAVYRLHDEHTFVPGYADALFRTDAYRSEYICRSTGIRSSRLRLYPERFLDLPIVCPSREEQEAIAEYLNYNAAMVARFVRTKRRQIEILNEQRTALAKALLAQATATCSLVRLRFVCTKFGSGVTPRGGATNYVEAGIPFLRSQNVHFGELRLDDVAYIPLPIHQSMSGTHVRSGDVLLNITGASIGRVCAVPTDIGEANVNQHVCIIRPIAHSLDARYLAACLSLPSMQDEIYMSQNGASREGLPIEKLKSFAVPLPSVQQQKDLVKDLEAATAHITRAISAANSQIDLVRNFRTGLVASVVTGKLDVRQTPIDLIEAPIEAFDAGEDMADENELVQDEAEEVTIGGE